MPSLMDCTVSTLENQYIPIFRQRRPSGFSRVLTARSAAELNGSLCFISAAVTVRMISEIMGGFRDKITEGKQSNQSLYMTNEPL